MRTVTYDETKWKLVPVTGSLEMIDAFKKEMRKADSGTGDSLRAAVAAAPDHPATDMAAAIHYPDCWDTAAYPTLESALRELAHSFQCTNDECAHRDAAGDALLLQFQLSELCEKFTCDQLSSETGNG